jgi:hypothetical protein
MNVTGHENLNENASGESAEWMELIADCDLVGIEAFKDGRPTVSFLYGRLPEKQLNVNSMIRGTLKGGRYGVITICPAGGHPRPAYRPSGVWPLTGRIWWFRYH